jgi:hypothetical protein
MDTKKKSSLFSRLGFGSKDKNAEKKDTEARVTADSNQALNDKITLKTKSADALNGSKNFKIKLKDKSKKMAKNQRKSDANIFDALKSNAECEQEISLESKQKLKKSATKIGSGTKFGSKPNIKEKLAQINKITDDVNANSNPTSNSSMDNIPLPFLQAIKTSENSLDSITKSTAKIGGSIDEISESEPKIKDKTATIKKTKNIVKKKTVAKKQRVNNANNDDDEPMDIEQGNFLLI